jgi:hypothetical protein
MCICILTQESKTNYKICTNKANKQNTYIKMKDKTRQLVLFRQQ